LFHKVDELARIIGVASGKGGVGKTTVATNLALALRDFRKKVLLVDCNLTTPHLAYYLGTSNYKYTLNDALRGKVDIISTTHLKDGIKYIPASLDLNDLVNVDVTHLKKNLKKLPMDKFDFILLDAAPGLGREALAVLDASDEIIFVTTPFVPMVNDVIRSAEVLKNLRGAKNVSVVMNMITEGPHEILSRTISTLTGFPVVGQISFDQNIVYGLAAKSPVVNFKPNSISSVNFRSLAANLIGVKYQVPHKIKVAFRRFKNKLMNRSVIMPQSTEDLMQDLQIEKKK
jgi:MinD-like ATPase involved in chromosome partitioning or flagellar assembly